jgi:dolichyl-phosphate-mannose--protein O-mannosyl transferase
VFHVAPPPPARPRTLSRVQDWLLLYEEKWGSEYIPLRQTSAIVGSLLIVLAFYSARAIGCGKIPSFLAAWAVGMEALILLQARHILCDVFLYFFNVATLGASFASVRAGLSPKQQLVWCGVTGLALGCAMSVKLTALGVFACIGVHQLACLFVSTKSWPAFWTRGLLRAAVILSVAATVFFGLWTLHVAILPYSGQGDGFMIPEFQATLVEKTFPHKPACPNHVNAKFDCGFYGITEEQVRKCLASLVLRRVAPAIASHDRRSARQCS